MNRQRKKIHTKEIGPSLTKEGQTWYASKSPVLFFGLKFGILLLLFYGLLTSIYFDHILYYYLEANAWLANAILNLFNQNTHVSEVTIRSQSHPFSMVIQRGCDAVEPTWLVCAAILSLPASWKHKILGILSAVGLLQTLNLVRIITLYWIGIHLPAFFNSAHMEIWPTIFIIVAISLFIGWKGWAIDSHETHAA